ncbi:hypothetical protein C8R44DRAFT_728493 [Mycena epipterygia]|nr:hypothetical protein C8R44DRAFT_728493 [Mycena epipterygia]
MVSMIFRFSEQRPEIVVFTRRRVGTGLGPSSPIRGAADLGFPRVALCNGLWALGLYYLQLSQNPSYKSIANFTKFEVQQQVKFAPQDTLTWLVELGEHLGGIFQDNLSISTAWDVRVGQALRVVAPHRFTVRKIQTGSTTQRSWIFIVPTPTPDQDPDYAYQVIYEPRPGPVGPGLHGDISILRTTNLSAELATYHRCASLRLEDLTRVWIHNNLLHAGNEVFLEDVAAILWVCIECPNFHLYMPA